MPTSADSGTADAGTFGDESPVEGGGWLARPVAYALTVFILVTAAGWTHVVHPGRLATGVDPGYYTWRIEGLMSEAPADVLDTGADGLYSKGYRVTTPILGALLRRSAGVGVVGATVFLTVGLRVLLAVVIGALVFTFFGRPSAFHAGALGAGSLLIGAPFPALLDNLAALALLVAAVLLVYRAPVEGWARAGLSVLVLASGLAHPVALLMFVVCLVATTVGRIVLGPGRGRGIVRDELWVVGTVGAASIAAGSVSAFGIWGFEGGLGSSAPLVPPYSTTYFYARLVHWVSELHPVPNLLIVGVGIAAVLRRSTPATRRAVVLVGVWLLPLLGMLGFVFELRYTYYRFLNVTPAWLIMFGAGTYFLARLLWDRRRPLLRIVGSVSIAALLTFNLISGYRSIEWNDPNSNVWMSSGKRTGLDVVRSHLAALHAPRPVIFIGDTGARSCRLLWGFAKHSAGNALRYGLPAGWITEGFLYLGRIDSFLTGEPATAPAGSDVRCPGPDDANRTHPDLYADLSSALHREIQARVDPGAHEPVVVLADFFNPADGENAAVISGERIPPFDGSRMDLWIVRNRSVFEATPSGLVARDPQPYREPTPGPGHLVRVILALAALLLPGVIWLASRRADLPLPVVVGLGPALSLAALVACTVAALAITRAPLDGATTAVVIGAVWLLAAAPMGLRRVSNRLARESDQA